MWHMQLREQKGAEKNSMDFSDRVKRTSLSGDGDLDVFINIQKSWQKD